MAVAQTRLQVPGCQVMEFLGSGARSTIWRIRDRRTEAFYALKRVVRHSHDDDRFVHQALTEFRVASHFDHPAIRKYFRVRRVRSWLLQLVELQIFMEWCEGTTCQLNRPSQVEEVLRIFQVVAGALSHIHSRGFVHADMKPNNIIVGPDSTVKVIDFGQSCPIGTVKERIQGTPDFIAPEQVYRRPLDARTDIFNFGASLYWTLTGQAIPTILPKSSDSLMLVNELKVTPPSELNEQVTPTLDRLVMDCIEFQPSRRPDSARDIMGRLDLIAHTIKRNGNGNSGAGATGSGK